jgi:hypothetical protein
LNYNELPTNLDDQPRVKTPPLTVLYKKCVNCKYYVLSTAERYLEEKTEVLELRSFPSASLPRHKLSVKWYENETRYSTVRSRPLTACYVHNKISGIDTTAQERNKYYVQNHLQFPEIASFKVIRKVKSLKYRTPH